MSGRQLNPSQARVADCRERLCVIAGAGSGKTHTLVEALARRLEEGCTESGPGLPALDVGDILALTFTEKAAAELRQRLAETFHQRRNQASGEALAEFWRGQAARLDRADIGTIHSYALTLVRENAVGLGLSADPAIDDDPRPAGRDLEEVMTDWLDQEDPDLLTLLRIFSRRGLYEVLTDCAGRISSWGLTELKADLEAKSADYPGRLADFRRLTDETLTELENGELKITPDKKYFPVIRDSLKQLLALLSTPVESFTAALDTNLARAGATLQQSGNWYTKSGQARKKGLIECLEGLIDQWSEEAALPVKRSLLNLLNRLPEELSRRKRARGAIDFDDILIMARRLLAGRPGLRQREIRRRKLILIDEFQDTNRLQADILAYLLLSPDDDRSFPESCRVWEEIDWAQSRSPFSAYGDLKQSIYRFRGAEVEVMDGLARSFSAGSGQVLPLDYNYRSQEPLINFFNTLFDRHLGRGFGPLDRQSPVRPPLYGGAQVVHLRSRGPKPAGGLASAQAQAELLVRYLAEICGPNSRVRVSGLNGEESRCPGPGDLAVLFRRFTWAKVFKEKLTEAGWKCRLAVGDNPFDYAETKGLVAAFDYLNGLDVDLSLAACLRSPLGPVSDQALLALAWPGPAARPRPLSFWFTGQPAWPEDLSPEDESTLNELRELLSELAPLVGRVPAVEILERLVEERQIIALAGLEPDGEDRTRAVTRLLALSRSLGRRREEQPLGAAEELREIRLNWNEKQAPGPLLNPDEKAVTLMTVHGSKGLEFPVVVIAEADSRPRTLGSQVIIGPDGRLALRFKNAAGLTVKPADYRQLEEYNKEMEAKENGRLFYVAATRAQDHLVFLGWPDPKKETARVKKAEAAEEAGLPQATGSTVWLEALLDCPEAAALTEVVEYDLENDEKALNIPESNSLNEPEDRPEAAPALLEPMALNSQTLAATSLGRLLADPAAFYRECHLGLDLAFHWNGQEPFFTETRPDSTTKKDRMENNATGLPLSNLAPNQAGTLFHAVMEELDPVKPDLKNLLGRQARRLGLEPSRDEAEFLELKLNDFLTGPLGQAWRAGRLAGQPDYREWPFWLDFSEIEEGFALTLNGIIDLFFIGSDGSGQIVDYKLAHMHPGPELLAYENQLRLYAQAIVSAGFKGDLRAALYFAGTGQSHIHPVELEFPYPIGPIWPLIKKNITVLKNTRPLRPSFPGALNIVYF